MTLWSRANHQLIAKAISELHFEEVLSPVRTETGWKVELKSGITYNFQARIGEWGHLWVSPVGLLRSDLGEISAGQFFIDAIHETGMSELTLGTFLEEMNDTLYSDMQSMQTSLRAEEMAELDDITLQQRLTGHPKLLLNKGRMGWGANDLAQYSPEQGQRFPLHWILVADERLNGAKSSDWSNEQALEQSFAGIEKEKMSLRLQDFPNHMLMPVHPWQWDHVIKLQFAGEIAQGHIVDLGVAGDHYTAQVSLRTLSNADRPGLIDLKLPLSILNTSCVRGLPHKYLPITPSLSKALTALCQQDDLLQNVSILEEKSAWGYRHPLFHQVSDAPYRYHEQLGAVWRENVQFKLLDGEQAILAAALFHADDLGTTMLAAFAKKAGISIDVWLKAYAREVIIPLYHLQLAYGVGVVAHGQNVVVRLNNGAPVGLILKDFHGDLRLSTKHVAVHQKYFPEEQDILTHLPPEHLIHDLITGHFITTLRFLARALEDSHAMNEAQFHQVIASEISHYISKHKELVTSATDLLAPSFAKVIVNRVRFQIGYGDSSERPLPILGQELINPFHENKL